MFILLGIYFYKCDYAQNRFIMLIFIGIYFDKGGRDTPWGKTFAFERAEVQEYLLGENSEKSICSKSKNF